ncbi:MAG: type 1 glutamine amidotransferase-like domain-containing protein [Bacteriovoracaceae bacterium]|jgi:cyanophycinase|nr:type 1 glutamine amidotransferase-like domain-containing protein [Bacteriovoracaceae bacterium]
MNTSRPVYLFSDSQLLFRKLDGVSFLNSIIEDLQKDSLKAAYIGASNNDLPEFYDHFVAAMENIGIRNCRMIRSSFSKNDQNFLEKADIILLSGGDVEQGWDVFVKTGIREAIVSKHEEGAILIGISAGAIQLGLCGYREGEIQEERVFDAFQFVPYIIAVHEEKSNWKNLRKTVLFKGEYSKGIGISTGGGIIYHEDKTIEPIRFPLYEFSIKDNQTIENLLIPPEMDYS